MAMSHWSMPKRVPDGQWTECKERTNVWAWKHPHGDGTVTYTKLEGDVRMYDVDFCLHEEGKTVLHNVTLYAKPVKRLLLSARPVPARPPSPT